MELPKHILIVEDEVITQRYLKDILGQYDIDSTDCYDNAKETLEALKLKKYDLILMDINIKGSMDGIQLSRELLRTHSIPIVFITAHNDDNTFQEVLDLAPYGFIEKPFSSKDVVFSIKLAYKRYLQHENKNKNKNKAAISDIQMTNKVSLNNDYSYDTNASVLYQQNKMVKLNHKQNQLLEILVKNVNNVVCYDVFIANIWKDEFVADSALRTLVYSVRKVVPELIIISHSKMGYSLKNKIEE
jgi:DNA-binding response OmpR family regulator